MGEKSVTRDPFEQKDFDERRLKGRDFANRIDEEIGSGQKTRDEFFNEIYRNASGDGAQIPWADLAPKPELEEWLSKNSGTGLTAIDIACGLGDNSQALSNAGYRTTGFDLSPDAIEWAKRRFDNSDVSFVAADLFDLPKHWSNHFDLAFECYTLQALPPDKFRTVATAIARLIKPGGILLVYSRITENDEFAAGPPWPLNEAQYTIFDKLGFRNVESHQFVLERPDKTIPHIFMSWKKAGDSRVQDR